MSISGSYLDSGDFEEDEDDVEVEYPCPFCSDDYDLVELCHHIDEEHNLEATHGVCLSDSHPTYNIQVVLALGLELTCLL